jgi:NhaP-type Na+/H+ or K+/H+ antiporter
MCLLSSRSAPPDAAAASAILRQLHIPHRMVVILEGEGLLNDATALLVYRLAVSAAMGSAFIGRHRAADAGVRWAAPPGTPSSVSNACRRA